MHFDAYASVVRIVDRALPEMYAIDWTPNLIIALAPIEANKIHSAGCLQGLLEAQCALADPKLTMKGALRCTQSKDRNTGVQSQIE